MAKLQLIQGLFDSCFVLTAKNIDFTHVCLIKFLFYLFAKGLLCKMQNVVDDYPSVLA